MEDGVGDDPTGLEISGFPTAWGRVAAGYPIFRLILRNCSLFV